MDCDAMSVCGFYMQAGKDAQILASLFSNSNTLSFRSHRCVARGSRRRAQAIMGTNSSAIPVASSTTLNTVGNPPYMAAARTTSSVMTGTMEA